MKRRLTCIKFLLVAAACGGIPLVTEVSCNPYSAYLFRDDDDYDDGYYDDYYYDDYYYEDYYYDDYCDPFYCY